jgi:tetratricopeptide (TPR) repeat protein
MNDRVANRQERAGDLQNRMSDARSDWSDNRQDRQDNRQENRGDRQDDRQTNRGDRQDNRQTNRNDRQDNRQENRGDWSENFWDNAHDAYHDHWHDDFGDYWDHMWSEHPVYSAMAMTAWGVNRLSYWFGYGGGYYNPYYGDSGSYGGGGYYDYSQPLATYEQISMPVEAAPAEAVASATATTPAGASASSEPTPLMKAYDEARQKFYEGDYPAALERTNAALAIAPNDAALHEFKALTLFALGKYHDAAVTIHAVLAVGPGWDWTTFVRMYPSVDTYTAQLRAFESVVVANPKSADLHLLLAYHYITCGSKAEAIGQLQEVIELQPKDTVAVQLLQMIGGPDAFPKSSTAPPKAGAPAGAASIPKKDLVGDWKAKGDGDSSFGLKLADDNTFKWTYTTKGKAKSIEGVYAIDQNSLALQPDAGGVMLAEVTPPQNGKFQFQVVGSPPGDKGLSFSK